VDHAPRGAPNPDFRGQNCSGKQQQTTPDVDQTMFPLPDKDGKSRINPL